jgi:hypothetical protein
MKKSFILHRDSLDILDELTDEQSGKLFKAIKDFQNGVEPELDSVLKMVFVPFRNQFLRDDKNYENRCEVNRANGSKGGKQKLANATKRKQPQANLADSDNDNDSKKDNKNNNESEIIGTCLPSVLPILMNWLEYKRQSNFSYTDTGLKTIVKRFNALAYDFAGLESLVENAIINGYKGVVWENYQPSNQSKPKPKLSF